MKIIIRHSASIIVAAFILTFFYGCGQGSGSSDEPFSIVGKWKLTKITQKYNPEDSPTNLDESNGAWVFYPDGTYRWIFRYDGNYELSYNYTKEIFLEVSGAYTEDTLQNSVTLENEDEFYPKPFTPLDITVIDSTKFSFITDRGDTWEYEKIKNLNYEGPTLDEKATKIFELIRYTTADSISFDRDFNSNNLNNLSSLAYVSGDVTISNTLLTDFTGLTNLEEIDGWLIIDSNSKLETVEGLNNLNTIGQGLRINGNNKLTTLYGFNNLNSIGSLFKQTSDIQDVLLIFSNAELCQSYALGMINLLVDDFKLNYGIYNLKDCDNN